MKRNLFRHRGFLSLIVEILFGAAPLLATPRDELLRVVPDDVTVCAVLQDLRERSKNGSENSFVSQLSGMPFFRAKMESPEVKKLLEIQQNLFKHLNISPEQLRDDLLGDAVVFAYRQGPANKPDSEQVLFLVWARDKALLVQIVDRVNQFQTKSGELKEVRERKYREQTYQQRIKAKGKEGDAEFYFIRENLIGFSPSESMIQAALDRERDQPSVEKEKPFWSKMIGRLGFDKALASFLINPRAFDAELTAHEMAAKGAEKAFLKEFRRYWQAFDGFGVYADCDENLELGVAVRVRKADLPKPAQQFFAELGKPSELWRVIPEDVLFALSSRIDAAQLAEAFAGFCDAEVNRGIQATLDHIRPFLPANYNLQVLLKGLGPDWGIWAFAPDPVDKTWVPQTVFAIKVRDSAEGTAAATTVGNTVQFLLMLAQFGAKDPIRVETIEDGKTTIKVLSSPHGFPASFRPSFAIKDGYVLFAGSPETIKRFKAPPKNLQEAGEALFLRISAVGWQSYLIGNKKEIAEFMAKATGTPSNQIDGQIDEVIENLKTFDRLEIAVKSSNDLATLTLRLKIAKPAK